MQTDPDFNDYMYIYICMYKYRVSIIKSNEKFVVNNNNFNVGQNNHDFAFRRNRAEQRDP